MAKEKTHNWQGVWDEGAGGWVEYFGAPDGLPARDLTNEDLAGFTAEQKAKLTSDTGQRLYHPVEKRKPAAAAKSSAKRKPVSTTLGTGVMGGPVVSKPVTADLSPFVDTGTEPGGPVPDAGLPQDSAGGA